MTHRIDPSYRPEKRWTQFLLTATTMAVGELLLYRGWYWRVIRSEGKLITIEELSREETQNEVER